MGRLFVKNDTEQWKYNINWSWVANRDDWFYAVNDERRRYNEKIMTQEQAYAKFEEYYPKEDFENGKT